MWRDYVAKFVVVLAKTEGKDVWCGHVGGVTRFEDGRKVAEREEYDEVELAMPMRVGKRRGIGTYFISEEDEEPNRS